MLYFHKDDLTALIQPNASNSGGNLGFAQTYDIPCGSVNLVTNVLPNVIDQLNSDFDEIVLLNETIEYTINHNYSNLSETCTSSLLRAVPQNCFGPVTYLWDTGATTETIPNDGAEHTVTIECNCNGGGVLQTSQREVYIYETTEYCVSVTSLDSTEVYEGCITLFPDQRCGSAKQDFENPIIRNSTVSNLTNDNDLAVYPNPFQDKLQVNFTSYLSGAATLRMYSVTGQLLFIRQIDSDKGSNSCSLDFTNLASGAMVLQFIFPSGEKMTRRVIRVEDK